MAEKELLLIAEDAGLMDRVRRSSTGANIHRIKAAVYGYKFCLSLVNEYARAGEEKRYNEAKMILSQCIKELQKEIEKAEKINAKKRPI